MPAELQAGTDDSAVNEDGDENYIYFPNEPEFVKKAKEIAGDN
jgi:hypothetical protein